jgi:hypothetical protein
MEGGWRNGMEMEGGMEEWNGEGRRNEWIGRERGMEWGRKKNGMGRERGVKELQDRRVKGRDEGMEWGVIEGMGEGWRVDEGSKGREGKVKGLKREGW